MANKTLILRFCSRDRKNFLEVKRGEKWVETRAAIERYAQIKKGDKLIFVCGRERLSKVVKRVAIHKSIQALFKKYKIKDVMPWVKTLTEVRNAYHSYSGYDAKIKKLGLIAWELK
ncbi:MAG: hypothetical protein A2750_03235 [Candidatus Yanofskybacteria bacterium RIFCSPHIGHO2_01_FULL_45_42]|uniref:ASCH domain-containing protein n=2 Tax=Candidatus Yanofskyibacteriota TaxID=1752733 RepID=A0A1F8FS28_9BACT|nr:MAG: hypothetical protein A2750_03235 [Candidatus Yanofskybacteria bacterium RIFCSPHIGHO2_01_FULL_45_42]OGN15825.1 MAG: hypothetical protein A3J47_02575 [Candidatus Yanofskybacteria bacterium RIFCSPHIGHO2_02_FULL_43_22]OGN28119.1 MAG: hypothetical protein A3B17_00425 [Candidatus Yanofskybacteria bacterium RIFCSPLOWO2_01_FULL_45_72]